MEAFETLVEILRVSAGGEDDARLTIGEAASLINTGWGDLKRAANQSNIPYKTLAERVAVIDYFEQLSASADLDINNSVARDYLAEFPMLRWKHLVIGKGLKDPAKTKIALERAIKDGMSVNEFARFVGRLKKALGHQPSRMVIDNGRGLRITIERY